MKKESSGFLTLTFVYVGVFFILREWLLPIMELTETGYSSLFIVFIGLALVLNLFRVPALLSGLLKLVYMLWFVTYVYAKESVFSAGSWAFLVNDFQMNMRAFLSNNFAEVTDTFRTLLFLVLIWMLVYLIHHWVTVRKSMFYFFAMTVFFIATLDTFTPYDGSVAIIRVVVLGFVMTGVLYVERLSVNTTVEKSVSFYSKLGVPLLLVVVLSSLAAVMLPKAEPKWPDPVPYIKSVTGQGSIGQAKVGYGEDDSQLGGSLAGDDSVVFKAETNERQYWRIETKDTYTSKGWVQSDTEDANAYGIGEPIDLNMPTGSEEKTVKIKMENKYPFIMQPYGTYSVSTNEYEENLLFETNTATGRIETYLGSAQTDLSEYEVAYRKPSYSLKALRATSYDEFDPYAEGLENYLQLPDTLPNRVRELSYEITINSTSMYEKIRAIEGYFRRSGFKYSLTDVATPSEGQDYVDQFLFETKVGYCNNFSSSMVVMLRSIGIPARWVKGFASGEPGNLVDGVREYTITNDDAHSWVEAYLPGIGWMPFEPTIGFSGVNNINFDLELSQQERDQLEPEEKQQLKKQEQESKKTTKAVEKKEEDTVSLGEVWQSVLDWLKAHQTMLTWVLIGLIGIVALVFTQRRKWLPKVYASIYQRKGANWASFMYAYRVLLKQLALCGLKRQPGETLHAFAEKVDRQFGTDDMCKLTDAYEIYIYSQNPENVDFAKLKESWEYLINRTTG